MTGTDGDDARRPPLLFVHGIHAGAWIFTRWLAWFEARGHSCLAVDLRGHGDAPLPAGVPLGRVRIADYVDDALAAAKQLGRPVVIGHSMGGLLAQLLAERDTVAAAVLVSSAPPRGITVLTPAIFRYQIRDLPVVLTGETLRPSWPAMRDLVLNRVPADERRGLFERLGPESGTVARELSITGVPVRANLARVPMLVLSGDEDRYVTLGRARRIARRYGAPLRVLSGRGHVMMREPGWEEAAATIAEWIEALPGPAGEGDQTRLLSPGGAT